MFLCEFGLIPLSYPHNIAGLSPENSPYNAGNTRHRVVAPHVGSVAIMWARGNQCEPDALDRINDCGPESLRVRA